MLTEKEFSEYMNKLLDYSINNKEEFMKYAQYGATDLERAIIGNELLFVN